MTLAASAAAVVVTFAQASAVAGEEVTVRATGLRTTDAVYLYLVSRRERALVRSARDRRLVFVARLVPRRGRASATFVVPPIATSQYVAWCRGCSARTRTPLAVTMPAA